MKAPPSNIDMEQFFDIKGHAWVGMLLKANMQD